MLCKLAAHKPLFESGHKKDRDEADAKTLAYIIALLGHPPNDLLQRAEKTSDFFNDDHSFKYPELIPSDWTIEKVFASICDVEEKQEFISFAKRMLTWLPKKRATSTEMLDDPWLREIRRRLGHGWSNWGKTENMYCQSSLSYPNPCSQLDGQRQCCDDDQV